jgi:hypothetical protein|nr:MAG TPA: hypothetical protein [Caudoviricetes sp.]
MKVKKVNPPRFMRREMYLVMFAIISKLPPFMNLKFKLESHPVKGGFAFNF